MNRYFVINLLFTTLVAVVLYVFTNNAEPQVVFVRSSVVLEQFQGMKEATRVFQEKKALWQTNLDTLNGDYQKAVSEYNLKMTTLSEAQKKEQEAILQQQYLNVTKYAEMLEQKAAKEDEALTQGVLNQVDEFIKAYAEENDYKLIVGTTNSGNLLYGDESLDITEDLIEALNNNYKK